MKAFLFFYNKQEWLRDSPSEKSIIIGAGIKIGFNKSYFEYFNPGKEIWPNGGKKGKYIFHVYLFFSRWNVDIIFYKKDDRKSTKSGT